MSYTNDMRYAVRALKNPTPLHFYVAENGEQINLLVPQAGYARLSKRQQKDFDAYVKQAIAVIELGGGGRVNVIGIKET